MLQECSYNKYCKCNTKCYANVIVVEIDLLIDSLVYLSIPEAAYGVLVDPLVWVGVVQQLQGGLNRHQRPPVNQSVQLTQH